MLWISLYSIYEVYEALLFFYLYHLNYAIMHIQHIIGSSETLRVTLPPLTRNHWFFILSFALCLDLSLLVPSGLLDYLDSYDSFPLRGTGQDSTVQYNSGW